MNQAYFSLQDPAVGSKHFRAWFSPQTGGLQVVFTARPAWLADDALITKNYTQQRTKLSDYRIPSCRVLATLTSGLSW